MTMSVIIKKLRPLWLCLIVIFTLSLAGGHVEAREVDFSIQSVDIEGQINSNGDVTFQEVYRYDVDYFNGMKVFIDYGSSPLENYKVGLKDTKTGKISYLSENNTRAKDTFTYDDDGSKGTFTVYHPAHDAQIDLVIEYTLDSLVTNYQDTAELNRKIVGENIDNDLRVRARIDLPGEVKKKEDFRVWGHGAPSGEIYPQTEGGQSYIDLTVPRNPAGQFVEVHAIFPTSLTPNNTNVVDQAVKDKIIQSENDQVEKEKAAYDKQQGIRMVIAAIIALLGLPVTLFLYWYYFHSRKKLNPNPAHLPEHVYSLPADISPAVMAAAVLRQEPNADDFSATILDLARKRYIDIEEIAKEKRGLFHRGNDTDLKISKRSDAPSLDHLQKHEEYVFNYLLKDTDEVTLDQISERIKNSKSFRKQEYNYWNRFKNNASVKGKKLIGTQPKAFGIVLGLAILELIVTIATLTIGSVFIAMALDQTSLLVVHVGLSTLNLILVVILLFLDIKRPPMTYERDRMIKEWKSFANMLKDIGQMDMREIASLPLWEEFLSYAVSLGVADKVIEAMNMTYGQDELDQLSMPGTFYSNPMYINSMLRQSMADNIASAAPRQTSSYSGSNTGGFGGGFSGGSSGGSGGGSGAGGF